MTLDWNETIYRGALSYILDSSRVFALFLKILREKSCAPHFAVAFIPAPAYFLTDFSLGIRDNFAHRALAAAASRARAAGLSLLRIFRFPVGFRFGARVGAGTGVGVAAGGSTAGKERGKSDQRLLPARTRGWRQEAEHEHYIFFEGGFGRDLLAIAVVQFAGMAAQLFDGRDAQTGMGEGVNEHIQQRDEFGVVEGLLVVEVEPVLKLAFSEAQ